MMKDHLVIDLAVDPRAAGEVARYHTWAVHRQQSVGEHTWQILRILLTVWPGAPRRVMIHTVKHDMGEMTGDIAYPFKMLFPELKSGSIKAEAKVLDDMRRAIGIPQGNALSAWETHVFKLCEYIEMWEYGLRERNMGNRYAAIIIQRMIREIGPAMHKLEFEMNEWPEGKQNPDIVTALHRYIKQRETMEATHGQ